MSYTSSNLDRSLTKWFTNDNTRRLLRKVALTKGAIRGLNPCIVPFDFPLTAIAGKNGAGKSTILALAACGYHSEREIIDLDDGARPYYRFSDFFIQQAGEVGPAGIEIGYWTAHDKWAVVSEGRRTSCAGIYRQRMEKKSKGRWTNYNRRMNREVFFLGFQRIVPHAERSQFRSYSSRFKLGLPRGTEDAVSGSLSSVLGRKYNNLRFLRHSRYRLPTVSVGGSSFSGFNMGAGEASLIEILFILHSCDSGSLVVIDEVELGLHADARKKLIREMKRICLERKVQVVCSTHSREVFDALPPSGRLFVETNGHQSVVTPGVSADFAMRRMGDVTRPVDYIFVEDDVAKSFVVELLNPDQRNSASIVPCGSAEMTVRQLAACMNRNEDRNAICVLDGDQRSRSNTLIKDASDAWGVDRSTFAKWAESKVLHLPGEDWPEAWLVRVNKENPNTYADLTNSSVDRTVEAMELAQQAGKHNEVFELAQLSGLAPDICRSFLVKAAVEAASPEVDALRKGLDASFQAPHAASGTVAAD